MYLNSQVLFNDDGGDEMRCYALALVPRTENVVAVGYFTDNNFDLRPKIR